MIDNTQIKQKKKVYAFKIAKSCQMHWGGCGKRLIELVWWGVGDTWIKTGNRWEGWVEEDRDDRGKTSGQSKTEH